MDIAPQTAIISVIIPVYKVEPYLQRCVESVIHQTYPNLEIILVDDGSPDRCGQICDRYALQDNRVRVIHQENQGVSSARNAGMKLMTGEYCFFLDSDDYIDLHTIETLYNRAKSTNADLVIGNISIIDEHNQTTKNPPFPVQSVSVNDRADMNFRYLYFYAPGFGIPAWNKLYRVELIQQIRLSFDETLKIAEDYPFNLVFFFHHPRIECVDESTYFYCNYASTISKSNHENLLRDICHIHACQLELLEKMDAIKENQDLIQFSVIGSIHKIIFQAYMHSQRPFREAKSLLKAFIKSAVSKETIKDMAKGTVISRVHRKGWRWYARAIGIALSLRWYSLVVFIHFIRFRFEPKGNRRS